MAVSNSQLPFPYLLYQKAGWGNIPLDVLVVRATFDLGANGKPMTLAATQTPLQLGDELDGDLEHDLLGAVLKRDGDIVVGKLGTDVILSGHVHSPESKPARDWIAAVRVGTLSKALRVTGPRTFKRTLFGWKITRPAPVTRVALDYRLAFGGRINLPAPDKPIALHFPSNPAGTGWLPTAQDMKGLRWEERRRVKAWVNAQRVLTAPQFEHYTQPIRTPSDRPVPEGFGPIARWWEPRVSLQGTLDKQWEAERFPDPPDDYDPRFTHSAHPHLTSVKHLEGDEEVVIAQCLPEKKLVTALPGIAVQAMTVFRNGLHQIRPLGLDTVRIDLDTRTCVLLFRTLFDRSNPPVEIDVTAMPVAIWRKVLKERARMDHG